MQDGGVISGTAEHKPLLPGKKLLTPAQKPAIIEGALRTHRMTERQTLIMLLGSLEDLLGIERSIPKRKR